MTIVPDPPALGPLHPLYTWQNILLLDCTIIKITRSGNYQTWDYQQIAPYQNYQIIRLSSDHQIINRSNLISLGSWPRSTVTRNAAGTDTLLVIKVIIILWWSWWFWDGGDDDEMVVMMMLFLVMVMVVRLRRSCHCYLVLIECTRNIRAMPRWDLYSRRERKQPILCWL